ncbi:MAG: chorismate synthase [Candidatus Eisenbacteria bacterium]|uniref:Chorismate synthase n=1 Tax=Eiseniibacteriota bacterium TaxID=2212470 RepID=A0A956NFE8_UNCEI|nr:chorismate synthase [Candidatus Eisenbacteria bacterium]MCB9465265.1 chorismate synthase [Candidatus Eisenbacteria bacterium]
MGSSFGTLFRISTWGESHGGGVGVVVDGCPPLLELSEDDIQPQLDRRRPGQSRLTTPRRESDTVRILSGVFEGKTLGTPILLMVENEDARPSAYEGFRDLYRPSHADFTYDAKYGIRNWQGGGRSSARETVGRVAAGAIAEKILALAEGVSIISYVRRVGSIEAADPKRLTRKKVDANDVRCPDGEAAEKMAAAIDAARRDGDSLGGIVETIVTGTPAGLGIPVFDRLEADLAKAMLSLPASKGFEIGSGFDGTFLRGSEHNDPFVPRVDRKTGETRIGTTTNRSGGVQGGISNGEPIVFRVAFKPTATIRKPQRTVDTEGRRRTLEARGRHDPCVLPRAVPVVEAMTALVLVDHWLRQLSMTSAVERMQRSSSEARRPTSGRNRSDRAPADRTRGGRK